MKIKYRRLDLNPAILAREKQVVAMRDEKQMSFRAIASALGVDVAQAYRIYKRGEARPKSSVPMLVAGSKK